MRVHAGTKVGESHAMETAERLGLPAPLVSCSEAYQQVQAQLHLTTAEVARAVQLLGDDQRQLLALQRKARDRGLESAVVRGHCVVSDRPPTQRRPCHCHATGTLSSGTRDVEDFESARMDAEQREAQTQHQRGPTNAAEMVQLSGCSIHSNQRSGNEGVRVGKKVVFSEILWPAHAWLCATVAGSGAVSARAGSG